MSGLAAILLRRGTSRLAKQDRVTSLLRRLLQPPEHETFLRRAIKAMRCKGGSRAWSGVCAEDAVRLPLTHRRTARVIQDACAADAESAALTMSS